MKPSTPGFNAEAKQHMTEAVVKLMANLEGSNAVSFIRQTTQTAISSDTVAARNLVN